MPTLRTTTRTKRKKPHVTPSANRPAGGGRKTKPSPRGDLTHFFAKRPQVVDLTTPVKPQLMQDHARTTQKPVTTPLSNCFPKPTPPVKRSRGTTPLDSKEGRKRRKVTALSDHPTLLSPTLGPFFAALSSAKKKEVVRGARLAKLQEDRKKQIVEVEVFNVGKEQHPFFTRPAPVPGGTGPRRMSSQAYREKWDALSCPLFPSRDNHSAPRPPPEPLPSPIALLRPNPPPVRPSLDDLPKLDLPSRTTGPCATPCTGNFERKATNFRTRHHFNQWLKSDKGQAYVKTLQSKFPESTKIKAELKLSFHRYLHPPPPLLSVLHTSTRSKKSKAQVDSPKASLAWAEKYRPTSPNHLIGYPQHAKEFNQWMKAWLTKRNKKQYLKHSTDEEWGDDGEREEETLRKAVILVGPSGAGKTSLVYSAAQEHGLKVIEMSPGMNRSAKAILTSVGEAALSRGLKKKDVQEEHLVSSVILLDEADLVFEEDQGFTKAMKDLVLTSKTPIILTCNTLTPALKSVAPHSLVLTAELPEIREATLRLTCVALAEGLRNVSIERMGQIFRQCRGDMRPALSLLQIPGDHASKSFINREAANFPRSGDVFLNAAARMGACTSEGNAGPSSSADQCKQLNRLCELTEAICEFDISGREVPLGPCPALQENAAEEPGSVVEIPRSYSTETSFCRREMALSVNTRRLARCGPVSETEWKTEKECSVIDVDSAYNLYLKHLESRFGISGPRGASTSPHTVDQLSCLIEFAQSAPLKDVSKRRRRRQRLHPTLGLARKDVLPTLLSNRGERH